MHQDFAQQVAAQMPQVACSETTQEMAIMKSSRSTVPSLGLWQWLLRKVSSVVLDCFSQDMHFGLLNWRSEANVLTNVL